MSTRTDGTGNTAEIRLSGDLDLSNAAATTRRVEAVLDGITGSEPAGRRLVVDLDDVPFIDSSGLGALLRFKTGARSWN